MSDIDEDKVSTTCISDELFSRYLEKEVSEEEAKFVQEHLNSCPICFEVFTSFIRSENVTLTADEKSEIDKKIKLTPSKQVSLILDYHEELNKNKILVTNNNGSMVKTFVRLIDNIRKLLKKIFEVPVLKPAYALICVMICTFGVWSGFKHYNTTYQIKSARIILENNFPIARNQPQLDGNYKSSGMGALLSANQETNIDQDYFGRVNSYLLKAKKHNADSIKINRLFAQIAYIKEDYESAISNLKQIERYSTNSPGIKNDLGAIYFRQGELEKAAEKFEAAIIIDPTYYKAYFNLALAKIELKADSEVGSLLSKYIELEKDEGWKNRARNIRKSWDNGKNEILK